LKIVNWTDEDGFNHRSLLKDSDHDSLAPRGIPQDPPDVRRLNWRAIQKNIHNELLNRGLLTFEDVQERGNEVSAVIKAALLRPIIRLYREKDGGK